MVATAVPPAPTHVAGAVTNPAAPSGGTRAPAPSPALSALEGTTVPLRGSAARVVSNMTTSLDVPTATSFRVVPAKMLEVNRLILNNQLARTGTAGKVSFTHLIGWAVVQAVRAVPGASIRASSAPAHDDGDNAPAKNANANHPSANKNATPAVFRPAHVNLGIAVDLERPDGTRSLMVPVIKQADTLDFRGFWQAYEELVRKVRSGKGRRERLRRRRP